MLNRSEKNPNDFMAFEPFYLEVKPDNIVKFVLVDKGHGSKSLSIPKKALPWNSGLNNEIEVLLKEEGFYLYECRPHTSMGMVGLIRVGSPSKKNIKETKKKLLELQKNIKMNHKRIEELINLVR